MFVSHEYFFFLTHTILHAYIITITAHRHTHIHCLLSHHGQVQFSLAHSISLVTSFATIPSSCFVASLPLGFTFFLLPLSLVYEGNATEETHSLYYPSHWLAREMLQKKSVSKCYVLTDGRVIVFIFWR